MDTIERIRLEPLCADVDGLCSPMTDDDGHTARNIIEHLTNRWALRSLCELGRSQTPLRFSGLQRAW